MMLKKALSALAIFCALMFGAIPAQAQINTETFSTYVLGLPAAGSMVGTEKMFAIQGGGAKTMTPYQILSVMAGDCSMASPPTIICNKTNGVSFAPSATTDATNAANIGSGLLPLGRLALANGDLYIGNASNIPAAVAMSGDCTITNTGAITCPRANGVLFATSATTDTTNASNIGSGTLNTARLPAPFTSGTASGNTSKFCTMSGSISTGHMAVADASGNLVDGGSPTAGGTVSSVGTSGLATGGPFMTTGTVNVPAASKANQQSSSTTVAVTPGVQQFHPSAVKAWAIFGNCTSSPCTLSDSFNISSVTRNATGDYTVNFATPFATANYACTVMAGNATSSGVLASGPFNAAPLAGAYRFASFAYTGGGLVDAAYEQVICSGTQ